MKRCPRCKQIKSTDEFYRSSSTKDGFHCWCKLCVKEQQKEYHKTDGYKKSNNDRQKRFAKQNRQKLRAAQFIYYAVMGGLIEKPGVGDCGHSGKIEAHHYLGYEQRHWVDIIWVCSDCHKKLTRSIANVRIAKRILRDGGFQLE